MKILISYYSKTGSTEKVAYEIKKRLEELGCYVDLEKIIPQKEKSIIEWHLIRLFKGNVEIQKPQIENVSGYDVIILGTPNWTKISLPLASYIKKIKGIEDKKIGFFSTTYFSPFIEYLLFSGFFLYRSFLNRIELRNATIVADLFLSGKLKLWSFNSNFGKKKINIFCGQIMDPSPAASFAESYINKRKLHFFSAFMTSFIIAFLFFGISFFTLIEFLLILGCLFFSLILIILETEKKDIFLIELFFGPFLILAFTLAAIFLALPSWLIIYFYFLILVFIVFFQSIKMVAITGVSIFIFFFIIYFKNGFYSPKYFFVLFLAITLTLFLTSTFKKSFKNLNKIQRKLAQINLKLKAKTEELEKFKLASDNVSDHITITDSDGTILYTNKAVETITGYAPEEIIGTKVGVIWSYPMDYEFYQNLWKTIKEDKKIFFGELKNRRKNGEIYESFLSITPILNEKGNPIFFVGIERDITKAKEIDKAKSEFVSLASHQLRTPLSSINWYIEMIISEKRNQLDEIQEKCVKEISFATKRMTELVDVLLNLSRIEMGSLRINPQPTNLKKVADSVLGEIIPHAQKKEIILNINYGEIPEIKADEKLARIIFQNLLSNAVKYTPDKGKINLDLFIDSKNPDYITIKISDTGYGIPESQKDKIFTKLFRADNIKERDTDGTGLGLYLVKAIVEGSQGKIWFESEENKGTTFYVLIPLSGMIKKEGSKSLI